MITLIYLLISLVVFLTFLLLALTFTCFFFFRSHCKMKYDLIKQICNNVNTCYVLIYIIIPVVFFPLLQKQPTTEAIALLEIELEIRCYSCYVAFMQTLFYLFNCFIFVFIYQVLEIIYDFHYAKCCYYLPNSLRLDSCTGESLRIRYFQFSALLVFGGRVYTFVISGFRGEFTHRELGTEFTHSRVGTQFQFTHALHLAGFLIYA